VEKLWQPFSSAIQAALGQYGPAVVLLILAVIILEWRLYKSYDARLKDKDDEIKRISGERDRLQDIILKNRLTTEKHKGGKHHD
jgi:hypothetical protein